MSFIICARELFELNWRNGGPKANGSESEVLSVVTTTTIQIIKKETEVPMTESAAATETAQAVIAHCSEEKVITSQDYVEVLHDVEGIPLNILSFV